MTTVFVFNGPNLNLLGTRNPEVYGTKVLDDVEALCRDSAAGHGLELDFRQTNHEGTLVDWIHEAGAAVKRGEALGLVLNAAAYTHTSVALHDAIEGTELPTVEVHISNVHGRETFRHHSFVSPVAIGIVVGFGVDGYALAIDGLVRKRRPARSV
ncbi:type II 3-dehydroquinate dehydratase [Pseudonocardia sp. C8]|uniref:type II 3-dehydroquinate dehydratase n=1 Tax=Pseudonocardia sp. C8 TaxID=2762759 RepID=UPI001642F676|nr:type II 3-dehydroquinate dehydratase [Pseudonocardia sp. C8]